MTQIEEWAKITDTLAKETDPVERMEQAEKAAHEIFEKKKKEKKIRTIPQDHGIPHAHH